MLQDLNGFNSLHMDIMKEIGSIGAGNAVTALSKMLGTRISMSVPIVNMVEFKNIAEFIGGPEAIVIGILVGITGDINGIMMFLVKKESAHTLLKILMPDNVIYMENDYNELELSALTEVGNILTSSYLSALARLIGKHIRQSVPSLSIDMANAILSVPAIEFGKVSDSALLIESLFHSDNENVSGYFLLIPDLPSFNIILSSLGVG